MMLGSKACELQIDRFMHWTLYGPLIRVTNFTEKNSEDKGDGRRPLFGMQFCICEEDRRSAIEGKKCHL